MSNYIGIEPFVLQPMTQTGTFATSAGVYPPYAFGLEVRASDKSYGAGIFRFCQGSDVGTSGLVVYISNNSAVKLAAAQLAPVGIAAGVMSATNQWGWVQVQGVCDYGRGTNVSLPATAALFVGTAGGFVVSGSVAGSRLQGMWLPASYTSSQSLSQTWELNRPYVQALTASM